MGTSTGLRPDSPPVEKLVPFWMLAVDHGVKHLGVVRFVGIFFLIEKLEALVGVSDPGIENPLNTSAHASGTRIKALNRPGLPLVLMGEEEVG